LLIHDGHIVMVSGPVQAGEVRQFIPVFHVMSLRCGRRGAACRARPRADTGTLVGCRFSQRLARTHPQPPVISGWPLWGLRRYDREATGQNCDCPRDFRPPPSYSPGRCAPASVGVAPRPCEQHWERYQRR
jgi:hypothetical protein